MRSLFDGQSSLTWYACVTKRGPHIAESREVRLIDDLGSLLTVVSTGHGDLQSLDKRGGIVNTDRRQGWGPALATS